ELSDPTNYGKLHQRNALMSDQRGSSCYIATYAGRAVQPSQCLLRGAIAQRERLAGDARLSRNLNEQLYPATHNCRFRALKFQVNSFHSQVRISYISSVS